MMPPRPASMFLAILFYATTLWSPSQSVVDFYIKDNHRRMQHKIKKLMKEIVLDTETKVRAVQLYRDQYYKSLQFQLGDIVYELRHNFKVMNIQLYIDIRRLAVEIENKVVMIQEWQYRRATPEEHHASMREPLRSGTGRDDESQELLRESAARGRIERGWGKRPPPPRRAPPAPRDAAKRQNKKWQYVRGYEFV